MKLKRDEIQSMWVERLKNWRQSGLTRFEFCRDNGIKDHQFRYWASRLTTDATVPPAFAKAVVETAPASASYQGAVRLVMVSGVVVEFSSGSEPSWIGRVAKELTR
jgi:hypothetical protein